MTWYVQAAVPPDYLMNTTAACTEREGQGSYGAKLASPTIENSNRLME